MKSESVAIVNSIRNFSVSIRNNRPYSIDKGGKVMRLFEKGNIGKVELKNRLVMSPMGCGLAELDGSPSEDMIEYYEARARGGAGLIIPEITRVNDVTGAGMMRQLSVSQDRNIEPLSKLVQAVHKHGTKIFIQLHHPGREGVSSLLGGAPVAAPSAIPCKVSKQETRALTTEEVKGLVQDFIAGAVRAKKAGADGVELHAAHGYLLQQFLSPYTNKRNDEYGGSFDNRLRMLLEIIEGIRRECGADFPIGVRLSVEEFLDQTGVTEDYIHIQDGIKIAMALEKAGADFIDVSCGLYETGMTCVEPISFPQGWRYDLIKAVKDHVNVPIISVSAIREPEIAEKFLEEGVTDYISLGRAWLADEDWGTKVLEGRENELRKCISCLRCFESLSEYNAAGIPMECAVNPRLCRELKYGDLKQDLEGHKAVVVGAGPAGMTAAQTLAERGVRVTLMDRQDSLGGTVNLAKKPPLKERMQWISDYYQEEFDRLGIDVKLGVEADADAVLAEKPDAVIVAAGSVPIVPKSIPGISNENVHTANEVLDGKPQLSGKNIALIGAGLTGLETAEALAAAGNKVTVIDMVDQPAPGANSTNVLDVCGRLAKYGVGYKLGNKLKEINENGVIIENVHTGEESQIDADEIVLSLGYRPDQSLADALREKGVEAVLVGSAVKDGNIAPATRTGYEAGRSLFTDEEKKPSFRMDEAEVDMLSKSSVMGNQEGIYLAYLTDPAAIARILPPPLKPFSMPVVTISINHVNDPSFADDYYEAILGVYAFYGEHLGLYPISLVLGGPGAEMATALGRDNASIPKKLGAEFVIRRNGDHVTADVSRRGTQLVDVDMKLGQYNNVITDALYMAPRPGKHTFGNGFYFHFDRMPDAGGVPQYSNGALYMNECEYVYDSWEPGEVQLKLQSSPDDPWAELPINTIIGGAYAKNTLTMQKVYTVEKLDARSLLPYLLPAWYDRTAFMETGRK